ncbi:unnamed protein product [Darwinula stevensoni]|uniref:Uncharacterized protein n=1 Tax=Darwinula stevensoni TaxID=69355 RepID=A0A7R9A5E6_9CRUS|nr:unnamed protein product [Darwinula stevensoni]CAG0895466.1 unnamed protein product [Darwinula stevensoni]
MDWPTWNEAGARMGEEAIGRVGFMDETSGAILSLRQGTWIAVCENLSPDISSPFTDWGYIWSGEEGEASRVDEGIGNRILAILKQKKVEWMDEDYPPIPLEVGRMGSGSGVLESLSLSLTGSLLHLSLLQVSSFPFMVDFLNGKAECCTTFG